MFDLNKFDLNLLLVFQRVLHEKTVSKAAASLGISQPTVSNALRRLRDQTGDELFIRTSSGMVPTPFAEELAVPVANALRTLQRALSHQAKFDPAQEDRVFSIVMTDISEIVFLPELIRMLAERAPNVRVQAIPHTQQGLSDALEQGRIDFAIGFIPNLVSNVRQQRIFEQSYVCVFRREHPIAASDLSVEAFSRAQHLAFDARGTGHNLVDDHLTKEQVSRNIKLRISHFVSVGHILEHTDLVAILPIKLAEKIIEPHRLMAVAPPLDLPKISIDLFWHAKFNNEPSNRWLRSLILQSFSE